MKNKRNVALFILIMMSLNVLVTSTDPVTNKLVAALGMIMTILAFAKSSQT